MKNYFKKETDKYGNTFHYNKRYQFHRIDGPAIQYRCGSEAWFINGERHREDGPAIELKNENRYWYINDIKYTEVDFIIITRSREIYQFNI